MLVNNSGIPNFNDSIVMIQKQ